MENISEKNVPYDENDPKSFAKWFRETAKDKWEKFLKGEDKSYSLEDRDSMISFLVEHGTKEEIQSRLDCFLLKPWANDWLLKEIESKRPDIKLDY